MSTRIPSVTGLAAAKSKTYQKPIILHQAITAAIASATSGTITLTTAIPSDDFVYVLQVRRANREVTGFDSYYSLTSGFLVYQNGTATLTSGDLLTVVGTYMK